MLSDIEKNLIREVNQIRTNPKKYAEKLIKNKQYFKGNVWEHPDLKAGIATQEGAAAYDDAIRYLQNAKPVAGLIPSKGLMKVAQEMCRAYARDKEVDIDATIEKYGEFDGEFGTLVEFGGRNAEMTVINLIVCDGDKTRGYRKTLMEPTVKKIGVSNGIHKVFKTVSVIVSADVFENKTDKIDKIYF
jgi:hypothetical protein